MFKKNIDEPQRKKEAETVIGQSVKVKGNFYGEGNMIVDGVVEGNVKTKNYLRVGEKAKITANVDAKDAYIAGEITGNIKVDNYLEIDSTGNIKGDIEAKNLSIKKGAQLNGHCSMGKTASKMENNN